jgi:hypothetical protein
MDEQEGENHPPIELKQTDVTSSPDAAIKPTKLYEIREAIQDVLDDSKSFSEIEGEQFRGLESRVLELARIWCWQNLGLDNYTADSILELYQFIQESWQDKLPLGPTAFRYCKTAEEIKAQHLRTKEILGNNLEAFSKGEKIDFERIGDYEIKMHRHNCEFGSGLICLSIWKQNRKVFQVSFYPSAPFKVYEIKGSKPADDAREDRKRKRDYHRFSSKYKLAPSSALIIECLKIAKGMGIEVDVAGWVSTWHNYGIAQNRKQRDQANSVYCKAREELKLKYDEQTETIVETAEALNQIYSEPKTEPNSRESWDKYTRCLALINSSSDRHASLFKGGKDEFVTKLLFSNYKDEHIQSCFDTQILGDFRNPGNDSWESLSIAVNFWARQNFQIPQRSSGYSPERDPKEDWLRFDLPLFMRVDAHTRDKIIQDHPQLNEGNE